jgi:hypothetical protein
MWMTEFLLDEGLGAEKHEAHRASITEMCKEFMRECRCPAHSTCDAQEAS